MTLKSINDVCKNAALISCPMLGSDEGIEPVCYARNVVIGGTLIFQPGKFNIIYIFFYIRQLTYNTLATCFIHIVAIFMTAIMLYHVRTKYTAIGKFSFI